jgi:hypothetical protein
MILSNTPTMREKQANQKIIVFEIELLVQHKNNGNSSTNRTSSNRNSANTTGSSEEPDDLPFLKKKSFNSSCQKNLLDILKNNRKMVVGRINCVICNMDFRQ